MVAFALGIITNEMSFSPPQIKLPSNEIPNPDMRAPEMNISDVWLDTIEGLVRYSAAKEVGCGMVLDPHRKLEGLFPEKFWES